MKTTNLCHRVCIKDLCSILANLYVGDDVFIMNTETVRNAYTCLKFLPNDYQLTWVGDNVLVERIA